MTDFMEEYEAAKDSDLEAFEKEVLKEYPTITPKATRFLITLHCRFVERAVERERELYQKTHGSPGMVDEIMHTMKTVLDMVAAEEREECAKVADVAVGRMDCDPKTAQWILDQIRARFTL